MFMRELERTARSMAAQKTEPEYIRHYLMETFQLDTKTIDTIFERVGIRMPLKPGQKKDPNTDKKGRQGFY